MAWDDSEPPAFDGPPFEDDAPMPQQPPRRQNGRAQQRSPYQHKTNRGSMFENDHKTTEKHPDFTGSIDIEGRVYWISAWKELTQAGKKRLSVSVKQQDERQDEPRQQRPQRQRSGW